ncbi:MAG: hypothetical protein GX079_04130 [Tissierellia bacterium]|nr:hypothetical protein [Tissierellia bacterium]
MKRRLLGLMDNIMGVAMGIFLVSSVLKFMDYRKNPEIYMVQSAPWYTSILINMTFSLVVILGAMAVKYLALKSINKEGK